MDSFRNYPTNQLTNYPTNMDWQRIILIILILAAVAGGYYYFQVYNVEPTPEGGSSAVAGLDARLNEIRPLAAVEFDLSLFDNPFFLLLQPIIATSSSAVVPGRLNPFVPY